MIITRGCEASGGERLEFHSINGNGGPQVLYGGFQNKVPQNGWFIMENPIF